MNNELPPLAEKQFESEPPVTRMCLCEVLTGPDLIDDKIYQDCFGKPVLSKCFYRTVYDDSYQIESVEPLEEGFYLEVQIDGFYRDDISEEKLRNVYSNTFSFAWYDDYINFWTHDLRYKNAKDMIKTVLKQLEPFVKTTLTEDKYLISERIFVDEQRNVFFLTSFEHENA